MHAYTGTNFKFRCQIGIALNFKIQRYCAKSCTMQSLIDQGRRMISVLNLDECTTGPKREILPIWILGIVPELAFQRL